MNEGTHPHMAATIFALNDLSQGAMVLANWFFLLDSGSPGPKRVQVQIIKAVECWICPMLSTVWGHWWGIESLAMIELW